MLVAALLGIGAVLVTIVTHPQAGSALAPGSGGSSALDWQPGLGLHEGWRAWTAAWVHWSNAHLAVNLLGAAVVGAVGWRARAPRAAALAWFVAWPLTHLLMDAPDGAHLAQSLRHYGGLSGVLHAGVVVLGLTLAWPRAFDTLRPPPESEPAESRSPGDTVIEPSRITEGPWAMTSLEELSAASFAHSRLRHAPPSLTAAQAARHRLIGAALLAGTLAKVLLESPWDLSLRPNSLLGIDVAPLAHACGIAAGALAWCAVAGGTQLRLRAARTREGASR